MGQENRQSPAGAERQPNDPSRRPNRPLPPGISIGPDGRLVFAPSAPAPATPDLPDRPGGAMGSLLSSLGFNLPPGSATDVEGTQDILTAVSTILGLTPLRTVSIPARLGLQAVLGGARGAVGGEDMEGILTEAAKEAGLELLGTNVGPATQRGMTKAGLSFGGVSGEGRDEAVDAIMRQNEVTRSGQGAINAALRGDWKTAWDRTKRKDVTGLILPGQQNKLQGRIDEMGDKLEKAERSAGTRTPVSQMVGFNEGQVNKIKEGATEGPDTINTLRELQRKEQGQLRGLARGPHFKWLAEQMRATPPANAQEASRLIRQGYRDPSMSQRFLGNVKRDASNRARDLIKDKMGPTFIPQTEKLKLHSLSNEALQARNLYNQVDEMEGLGLQGMNKELSDMLNMAEVNKAVRGGGGVLTDLGQFGIRGGVSSGLGGNVGFMLGLPREVGAAMGVLGPLGLNPKMMTLAGKGLGEGISFLPSYLRIKELLEDEEPE